MVAEVPAELRERLIYDTPFYARNCIKIVTKGGQLVPLRARPAQAKLEAALERQRRAGLPLRAIVLKSRQTGITTWSQAKALQRATQIRFYKALTIAQDGKTAGEIQVMQQDIMYPHLPTDDRLALKPTIRNQRNKESMVFGEPSIAARRAGHVGLNSSIGVQTAKEVAGGRGFTVHYLHLSEIAHYPGEIVPKIVAVINAVPDLPNTVIIKESTANGENHFKDDWELAEQGASDYAAVFISWLEDPDCWRVFADPADRTEFEQEVGDGPYGAEEPDLLEMGATLEQLYWRRWAIVNKCEGSLDLFHQEYPSTPDEAFLMSGRTVFDSHHIARVKRKIELSDPKVPDIASPGPWVGIVRAGEMRSARGRVGMIEVPGKPELVARSATGFSPRHPWWRIWEAPDPGHKRRGDDDPVAARPSGRYILTVDPQGGDETDEGDLAFHALTILNHRTLQQCASYRSRVDADLVAREAHLMGLYYNTALIVVEVSGGYGMSIAKKLYLDYRYRRMYFRRRQDDKRQTQLDRLGWSTDRATKPELEDGMAELLRQGRDGIRSRNLAAELGSHIRAKNGRTGPSPNRFNDELMSWMIGQHVAREQQPPKDRDRAKRHTSTTRRFPGSKVGY